MEQAVPDLTSPRVYQSPGGAGAHLSGLYKLFLGYSILSKSVFWPVLPQPYNRPEASGQAHTWPTCPLAHVVHGAPAYAEIRQFFWISSVPKMTPFATFRSLVCSHMGWMYHKLAQNFGDWQLLNLFFGSSQMDNWLSKYVHFKFWGGGVLQNQVYTWFQVICWDIDLNFV